MSDQSSQSEPATTPQTERPKRRWFRLFMICVLLLGVGVYFLPQIVASTSLKNQIFDAFKGDFPGTIEIGTANIDWTNTISLQDIKLRPNRQSDTVLTIAAIESDQSLIDLFSIGKQGLSLTIKAPELNLIVTDQGTNVDDLLPEMPKPDENAKGFDPVGQIKTLEDLVGKLPIGTITLIDGIVRVDDQPNDTRYRIEAIKTVLKRTNTPKALGIDFSGSVVIPDQQPQQIAAKGTIDADAHQGQFTTEFPRLTSGLIMPLIESSLPGWKLKSSGVQPGLTLAWDLSTAKPTLDLDATLRLDEATIANDVLMPSQRLYFDKGAVLLKSHPSEDLASWELQADVAFENSTLYRMTTNPQGITEPEVLWQEKTPFATVMGSYNNTADDFKISRAELNSQAASGSLAGQVQQLSSGAVLDLKGTMTIDFQKLSPALLGLDGQSVQLGKFSTQDFELKGPLFSVASSSNAVPSTPQNGTPSNSPNLESNSQTSQTSLNSQSLRLTGLTASSTLNWDQAYAYGVYSQQGKLKTELGNGVLKTTPLSVPVNGGRWLAPVSVDFNATPAVITVPQTQVFDNVQFTEQMARLWLKYVNPLLADSTGIEGRFSLELVKAIIPVGQMPLASIEGQLNVHQGRIGPGPLVQQVMSPAGMLGSIAPRLSAVGDADTKWLDMQPQSVPFAVQQGRVYHQNFRYKMGSAAMSTSGSVGLDQTLDILVEMPVPEKWKQEKPFLAALANTGFKIPIKGTLARPQPDFSSIAQQSKDFGLNAADGLIKELVNPGSGGEGPSNLGNLINGLIERRRQKKEQENGN